MKPTASPRTAAAQALGKIDPTTKGVVPPLHLATTYIRDPDNGYSTGFVYGRPDNETTRECEALLARRVLVGNFTTRGYGAARPVADNATAAGREANRRIEFLLRMEAPEGVETDPIGRFRDPEIEAQLVIAVDDADDEAPRPRARPGGD